MARKFRWDCPRCKSEIRIEKNKTKHHVCPSCYFEESPTREICRDCHNKIEIILKKVEMKRGGPLQIDEYFKIWEDFYEEKIDKANKEKVIKKLNTDIRYQASKKK